jgi:quercetin dioxygenase-like cupin family protein
MTYFVILENWRCSMLTREVTSLAVGVTLIVAAAQTGFATEPAHVIMTPDSVQWKAAPPTLPPGAEAAVLYGDPAKEGLFAMRLKLPKGYHIPPHTHPKPEVVTVISGTARLGMGETADQEKAELLPVGSFFALPPGMAHYAFADEDTVIQLNSFGPWKLEYVRPEDDPRRASQ